MATVSKLHNPRSGAFWAHLAEEEHAVQIYRDDLKLLDSLESFAGTGLRSGESVIIIATAPHLHELEKRLRAAWIDVDRCRWEDRYIALLAQETLETFMVNGLPDPSLFEQTAKGVLARARGRGRKLRAFGEMVGVLWAEGNKDAAPEARTLPALLRLRALPASRGQPRIRHREHLRRPHPHRSRLRLGR